MIFGYTVSIWIKWLFFSFFLPFAAIERGEEIHTTMTNRTLTAPSPFCLISYLGKFLPSLRICMSVPAKNHEQNSRLELSNYDAKKRERKIATFIVQ